MSETAQRERTSNWDNNALEQAQITSDGLSEALAVGQRSYFTEEELDALLPVEEGLKPASAHWNDLRTMYYQIRQGVDSDRQLVYTFARCTEALSPNRLSHGETIAKAARYMRAMQHGLQARDDDPVRDHSEAQVSKLLYEARAFISDAPLLAFDQARKSAELTYTPIRRVQIAGAKAASTIRQARKTN